MKNIKSIAIITGLCLLTATAFAGDKTEKKTADKDRAYAAEPTKVKFGEFKAVEIKATELAEACRKKGNEKSAAKIDEMLQAQLRSIFPNLKVIPKGEDFSKGGERTLQLSPRIEKIHLVTTGARVWLGVMAGGSDIVMHVDYRDSASGEIIANPDFWKGNNAWAGPGSWGSSDNQIRDAVVAQIVNYTQLNK